MRPPKKVLLYCEDEGELSRVGYALWTRAYRVAAAATKEEALHHAAAGAIDCVVMMSVAGGEAMESALAELQAALPDTPTLLAQKAGINTGRCASVVWIGWDVAGIGEALRVLCARRRGPKSANGAKPKYTWVGCNSKLQRVG